MSLARTFLLSSPRSSFRRHADDSRQRPPLDRASSDPNTDRCVFLSTTSASIHDVFSRARFFAVLETVTVQAAAETVTETSSAGTGSSTFPFLRRINLTWVSRSHRDCSDTLRRLVVTSIATKVVASSSTLPTASAIVKRGGPNRSNLWSKDGVLGV